jgi:multidrug efflux pump subunit AcrA (membrane-fusion protein)
MARQPLPTLLLLGGALAAGCSAPPPPAFAPRVAEVEVEPAVERIITDYEVFYGKTQAEKEVDVRARISGYLDKILFKDGAEVHEKDVLFEIDPRPLQAELERTEANVAQAEAHLQHMEYDYRRAQTLANNKTMSREDYDKAFGDMAESRAAVKSAIAARNTAELNLKYSRVVAPISGRISRRMVDVGNLIKADDTSLTRIVSLDPIYAYFDIDERTYLRVQRFLEQQEYSPGQSKRVPVALGLSDENASGPPDPALPTLGASTLGLLGYRHGSGPLVAASALFPGRLPDEEFPFQGEIDFVDNKVDPDSGSLWVRGTFPNAHRLLTPGLFVRVRLPVSAPHRAVLIPERALATDQGEKNVWVLDAQDHAWYRKVKFGAQQGPQRVIKEGVKPGERVIVSGLQKVRADPVKHYAEVKVLPPKDAADKQPSRE